MTEFSQMLPSLFHFVGKLLLEEKYFFMALNMAWVGREKYFLRATVCAI
jgi:hypothetical protein